MRAYLGAFSTKTSGMISPEGTFYPLLPAGSRKEDHQDLMYRLVGDGTISFPSSDELYQKVETSSDVYEAKFELLHASLYQGWVRVAGGHDDRWSPKLYTDEIDFLSYTDQPYIIQNIRKRVRDFDGSILVDIPGKTFKGLSSEFLRRGFTNPMYAHSVLLIKENL